MHAPVGRDHSVGWVRHVTGNRRLVHNIGVNRALVGTSDDGVLRYHQSWSGYAPTPLRLAPTAAAQLGVASLAVKDESSRFGMPSFKILGASWATHRALCAQVGAPLVQTPTMDALRRHLDDSRLTLVAATDGNHGRAVARMARLLNLSAHILVPEDMVEARIEALRSEGATVTIVPGGYDDAVSASARLADDRHLVISDTSWPGYQAIPGWVIDGYSTLTAEVETQRASQGMPPFTVAAVQIGVGAFAASIARAFRSGSARVVGVEPAQADCVISSVEEGRPIQLPGKQTSIMAGLNCGTPSPVAWRDVTGGIDDFVAVEDHEAEHAMRLLAADGIVSGESGAAGLAGLLGFASQLGLGRDDHVLVISTEGATDPRAYARIVGSPDPHVPELT